MFICDIGDSISESLRKWFYEVFVQIFTAVFEFILEKIDAFFDLIGLDFSPVSEVLLKINSFFPLDVLLIDFGIVLGVWFICLGLRAVINVAPFVGG